jgi:predicted DNA-binding antitoxin AbrB/MazE fold protein
MIYKGHVENGVIVLDEPVTLGEGTQVAIEVTGTIAEEAPWSPQSRYAIYRPLIGRLKDIPEDWSENHDRYLGEQHST